MDDNFFGGPVGDPILSFKQQKSPKYRALIIYRKDGE